MAFDVQNFVERWSTQTTIEFQQALTLGNMFGGPYEGDAQTADTVFVQRPDYNINITKGARRDAFPAGTQGSAGRLALNIDQYARPVPNLSLIHI